MPVLYGRICDFHELAPLAAMVLCGVGSVSRLSKTGANAQSTGLQTVFHPVHSHSEPPSKSHGQDA